MAVLFESVKLIFFLLTIAIAFLLFKGEAIFPAQSIEHMRTLLMPGYLVLCGLLIGYITYLLRTSKIEDEEQLHRISVQSFIIGIMLGIMFALVHTFVL
ncbi:hypothetical protein KA013_04255 [Patescibacteria group bacterium]|nr:hypothetical protein [Patescibacteria group bacterium]